MPRLINKQVLLNADTNGTSPVINEDVGSQASNSMFYFNFSAGTSAGTYVIETADSPSYGGLWSLLATVAWAQASAIKSALVTGPFIALRVRNTVVVVGGTCTVTSQING